MTDPYQLVRTERGAEFQLPLKAALQFAQFGAFIAGVLGGVVGAIVTGGVATLAGANDGTIRTAAWVVGLLAFGLAAWAAYRRLFRDVAVALLIEPDGRVSLGSREIVGAGEAVRVRVHEIPSGEDSPAYAVTVEVQSGGGKRLPVPAFGFWGYNRGFVARPTAEQFAGQVADALAVPLAP